MSSPSVSIFDLITPIPASQLRTTFVNALVAVGIPANQWRAGGVFSTILTVLSTFAATFSSFLASGVASYYLDYASGPWLIILAYYVYGVTAFAATFASGNYTLTNSGGGLYTFAAGTFRLANSATGQTYTNTAGFTLNPSSTLTIPIAATQAGSVGTSAPGAIDTIVTVSLGVTGTNAAAVVGLDAESDPALRARCQATVTLPSNAGPRQAYSAAILPAINSSGNRVNINRVSVSPSSSTNIVTITCASAAGAVSSQDLTAAATAVESLVRPTGQVAAVYSATAVNYTNTINVYAMALPGISAAALQALIESDLTAWMAVYPIGGLTTTSGSGYVYASGINAVIGEASDAIFSVTGATDMALGASQVITNGTTIIVTLVSPPS